MKASKAVFSFRLLTQHSLCGSRSARARDREAVHRRGCRGGPASCREPAARAACRLSHRLYRPSWPSHPYPPTLATSIPSAPPLLLVRHGSLASLSYHRLANSIEWLLRPFKHASLLGTLTHRRGFTCAHTTAHTLVCTYCCAHARGHTRSHACMAALFTQDRL